MLGTLATRHRPYRRQLAQIPGGDPPTSPVLASHVTITQTRNVTVHHPDLTPLTPEHGILAALYFVRYMTSVADDPPDLRTPTLVAAARHAGITWERIGKALGFPGQYVNKIYRGLPEAPLPADFPCVSGNPPDLEAELVDDRWSAFDDPRFVLPTLIAAARHVRPRISWQKIGTALGLKRQTVHEKYGHLTPAPLPPDYEYLTHVCEIHHAVARPTTGSRAPKVGPRTRSARPDHRRTSP